VSLHSQATFCKSAATRATTRRYVLGLAHPMTYSQTLPQAGGRLHGAGARVAWAQRRPGRPGAGEAAAVDAAALCLPGRRVAARRPGGATGRSAGSQEIDLSTRNMSL